MFQQHGILVINSVKTVTGKYDKKQYKQKFVNLKLCYSLYYHSSFLCCETVQDLVQKLNKSQRKHRFYSYMIINHGIKNIDRALSSSSSSKQGHRQAWQFSTARGILSWAVEFVHFHGTPEFLRSCIIWYWPVIKAQISHGMFWSGLGGRRKLITTRQCRKELECHYFGVYNWSLKD